MLRCSRNVLVNISRFLIYFVYNGIVMCGKVIFIQFDSKVKYYARAAYSDCFKVNARTEVIKRVDVRLRPFCGREYSVDVIDVACVVEGCVSGDDLFFNTV